MSLRLLALLLVLLLTGVSINPYTLRIFDITLQAPPQNDHTAEWYPGVFFERRALPGPVMFYKVSAPLNSPTIEYFVTPGDPTCDDLDARAFTIIELARQYDFDFAINANFPGTFWATRPWNYYPRSGDCADIIGLSISNLALATGEVLDTGYIQSEHVEGHPVICFEGSHAYIQSDPCPKGTLNAAAGNVYLVSDGRNVAPEGNDRHPRTAVGVMADQIFFYICDGRRPTFSIGCTQQEFADYILMTTLADVPPTSERRLTVIGLDGGGSTSGCRRTPLSACDVYNWPVQFPLEGYLEMPGLRPLVNAIGFRLNGQEEENGQETTIEQEVSLVCRIKSGCPY